MLIGFVYVAIAASCLGMMPTFQKTVMMNGLPLSSLMFYTNWVITCAALAMAIIRKKSLKASPAQWIQAVLMGIVGMLITSVLLNTSYLYIPVGTSIMLNFLYPAIVCIVMGTVFKGGFSRYQILAIGTSILGMVFLTGAGGDLHLTGVLLAVASAFTYGIYLVANEIGPANALPIETKLFYVSIPGSLFFTVKAIAAGSLVSPAAPSQWLLTLLGSGLFTVGGYFMMMYGIDKLGASIASFVSMLEPIVSVIFSTIWFKDPVTVGILAGGALIMTSILLIAIDGAKKNQNITE